MSRVAHDIGQRMAIWGKVFGAVTGFAVGGPPGAVIGAALGHAADRGSLLEPPQGGGWASAVGGNARARIAPDPTSAAARIALRMAAVMGRKDQLFAIVAVVLSAKLAKVDAPVNRAEIDTFKRCFRIPPESTREIGRLFDQARARTDDFEPFAAELANAFSDNRLVLEDVLVALFSIARADGPVNARELDFLRRVHATLGLTRASWERAESGAARPSSDEPDAYAVLGLKPGASDDEIRQTWRQLMREHHPDLMTARGAPEATVAKSGDRVARINAAWDRIKRERGL